MFRRRPRSLFLAGQGVLLSVVAILLYTNPVSAQQASPGASQLTAPALTAAAAANAVELRWDAVSGAVRYELWTWWDAETGWQQIGGDSLTGASSYTHTGVTAGRKYYYTIRAVNAAGEKSGWQLEYASATVPTASATPVASPLTAPKLTAAAVENAIELRWDAVSGAVRYELWTWWDAETGWQQIGGGNLTGTTYTHTGVSAGTTYYYSIRALFAGNRTGAWLQDYPSATALAAVSVTPTPVPAGALGQVQNLKAVVNNNEVTLTWDAMAGAVGYDLYVWDSGNPDTTTLLNDALTSTTYTHRGLREGRVYVYAVSAYAGKVYPGSAYYPGVPAFVYAAVFPNQIHAEIDGIRIIASRSQVIAQTRQVIAGMFKNRPDLIETMAGAQTVIFFRKGVVSSDWSGLATPFGDSWWAILVNSSVAPFGDEVPPGGPPGGTARSCDILIHELAHLVQFAVEKQAGGDAFNARLRALYQTASETGLWEDDYAAANYLEYWAVTVTSWFEQEITSTVAPPGTKLEDHDPAVAQLIVEVFGADASVPPACHA